MRPLASLAIAFSCLVWLAAPGPARAIGAGAAPYLLVGLGDADVAGTTIAVSNFELGANDAAVPMPGLTLVEPIPPDARPVPTGVPGDGNLAITDPGGRFDLSDVAIEATLPVRCAAPGLACDDGASNTTWNGLDFPSNGFAAGVDFAALRADLAAARNTIVGLPRDVLLTFPDGDWDTSLRIDLGPGLTVFDIATDGNDLLLQNRNLVIDGPPGATAVFRVPDEANFLVSQAALLLGDGGLAPGSVLFYTDRPDTNAHFSFSNAVVNGIAFWDLGDAAGEVAFSNVQGCTQVVGDKLNLSDVRLTRCAAAILVPEPGGAALAAIAIGAVGALGARRARAAG
jgi:hypothetical protein